MKPKEKEQKVESSGRRWVHCPRRVAAAALVHEKWEKYESKQPLTASSSTIETKCKMNWNAQHIAEEKRARKKKRRSDLATGSLSRIAIRFTLMKGPQLFTVTKCNRSFTRNPNATCAVYCDCEWSDAKPKKKIEIYTFFIVWSARTSTAYSMYHWIEFRMRCASST